MTSGKDKILEAKEVAKFFGVSTKTVWEWCKHGKLPAFKIGKEWKIRQSDLQRLISSKIRSRSQESLF